MRRARIAVVAAAGALGLVLGTPGQASAAVTCTFDSGTGILNVVAATDTTDLPHIVRGAPTPTPLAPGLTAPADSILVFDVNPAPPEGSPGELVLCTAPGGGAPVFATTNPPGGATTADTINISTSSPFRAFAQLRPVITMAGGFFMPGRTLEPGNPAESEIEFTSTGFPAGYPTVNGIAAGGFPDLLAAGNAGINLNAAVEATRDVDVTVSTGTAQSASLTGGVPPTGTTANGNDTLTAAGGHGTGSAVASASTLNGGAGTDSLTGGGGGDTLLGGSENDSLVGGAGGDFYNGGDGTDTASFPAVASGIHVDLAAHGAHETGEGPDGFTAVEDVVGTPGADDLHGNASNNSLTGAGGDDTIEGRGGDDTLSGGGGTNTVTYASAGGGVGVDLRNGGAQNTGGAGTDTLSGFQDLIGSNHGDNLTGTDGPNTVTGGLGSDTLTTLGGDDRLFIRDGVHDSANCGDGADSVIADRQRIDTIAGDCEGTDHPATASFSFGPGLTNDSTPTFGFTASEAGATFQCRVNRSRLVACPNPYTTTSLPDRTHLIEVTGVDAYGPDPILTPRQFTIDTRGPGLSRLGLDHRVIFSPVVRFSQNRRRPRRVTRFRFSLSEAGAVTLLFQKRTRGRRVGRRCRRETRRNRGRRACVRYVRAGHLPRRARSGRNVVRFNGHVRKGGRLPTQVPPRTVPTPQARRPGLPRRRTRIRRLRPGRYRVLARARDGAGNVSRVVRVGLRVVRPPRRR